MPACVMPEHLPNRYAPPSLRFNVRQFRRLFLVAGYKGLEYGPQAGGLPPVVLAPLVPQLLLFAGVVSAHARLPELAFLVGVFLARAPLYEPVQLAFHGLRACYVH